MFKLKIFFPLIYSLFLLVSSTSIVYAVSTWTNEGNMVSRQSDHQSVLLDDGKVFIVGGTHISSITNNTQLYTHGSSGSGSWVLKADMIKDRRYHTLEYVIINTSTGEKRVLAIGGASAGVCSCIQNTAELWNQGANSWTATPTMNSNRWAHASSKLSDGKVFVTGGNSTTSGTHTDNLSSTEVYDPIGDTWTSKASMSTARRGHEQVTFTDGSGNSKVMIIGGFNTSGTRLSSTEIYDPAGNSWSAGPAMNYARAQFGAVVLNDGRILVVAGNASGDGSEVYDPSTNSWTSISTTYNVDGRTAVVLGSGASYKVLAAGSGSGASSNAMLFDPSTDSWSSTTSMNVSRWVFNLITLSNGEVLASGGKNSSGTTLSSSEAFTY